MKQASIANEACFIGQRSKLRLAMKPIVFLSSFPLKEFLHNGATLFFENAGGDGSFRMKGIRSITQKATLFVRRTKYHTRYLAPA